MSKFQIVLLVIFGFFIILAVIVFSVYRGATSQGVALSVWGSIPSGEFNSFLNAANINQNNELIFRYQEFSPEDLSNQFTEALATGNGPDLLILPQDELWKNKSKIIPIPYESISERDFKNAFVEVGELFLDSKGIYALPLYVDPLVLYYNRDLLSAAGIAKPLAYWDEIYDQVPKLTKKDLAGNITQSIIALGEWRNISNFKDILSLLMLQAGTPIATLAAGALRPMLTESFGFPVAPGERALDFFAQWSNPAKSFYSWNRNFDDAQTSFATGDLAYYLGFASELSKVKMKSPALNFGLSSVPQSRVGNKVITFGRVYGLAISRGTKNFAGAFTGATTLVSSSVAKHLPSSVNLTPARRDLLQGKPKDTFGPVIFETALQAKGFIDPEANATREIFAQMVDAITSGRLRTGEALRQANDQIDQLIK